MKRILSARFAIAALLVFIFIRLPVSGAGPARAESPADLQKAGTAAALAWLKLVDNGRYEASWDDAATTFRLAITREDWKVRLDAFRLPLGATLYRDLIKADYTDQLPGLPDGHFVVVRFKTRFAAKKSSVETITVTLESGAGWRVAGYFIQ